MGPSPVLVVAVITGMVLMPAAAVAAILAAVAETTAPIPARETPMVEMAAVAAVLMWFLPHQT